MIDAISGTYAATQSTAGSNRTDLGQADFMSLLLTQLRNQDPLNPLQPHEFAAQLAGFSSVEQLAQLNQGMADQIASSDQAAALGKTSFSASLLGRTILAEGNQVHVTKDTPTTLPVDLGEAGGQVTVRLLDKDGHEVASRDLGTIATGGRKDLTLPADLPEGTYTVKVSVKADDGSTRQATTLVSGVVEKILFESGRIILRAGGIDIPLESLMEIAPPVSGAASSNG